MLMNKTVKFTQPIPFYLIRKAVKKVLDEYLDTSDLDESSKRMWKVNMERFYRDSAFTKVRSDLKGFLRDCKYSLFRDYDCSDLGTRDFVLIDTGMPGRILLCDDSLYHPHIVKKFSKDEVFTGIQYFISDTYDFSEEEKVEWFKGVEGIALFMFDYLEKNKGWISTSNSLFLLKFI